MKNRKVLRLALTLPALLLTGSMLLSLPGCDNGSAEPTNTDSESVSETSSIPDPVDAVKIYVAPNGNDENDGSEASPLATLKGAKHKLRDDKPESAVVIFSEGTYQLDSTLTFNFKDTPNVIYRAADGEKVTFTTADCLTGTWDGTEEINGHTAWVKSIPAGNGREEIGALYSESDFLVNARYPSKDGYLYAKGGGRAQAPDNADFAKNLSVFANPGDLPDLSSEDLSHAYLRILHYWSEDLTTITSYDSETDEIVLSRTTGNTVKPNDCYMIDNVRCGLDEPGEWYFDYRENKLYYLPKEGETQDKTPIYLGKAEQMFDFKGARNITFQNIDFAYSNWNYAEVGGQSAYGSAAFIRVGASSKEIAFRSCHFRCIGATCLNFGAYDSPAMDCTVAGCSFENIGMQALVIAGANDETNAVRNMTVTDNLIDHYGKIHFQSAGILQTYASGSNISHNEIANGSYTAISVGWTWGYADNPCHDNRICDNLIYHIGHAPLSDMGGIYTLGIQENSEISGNVIFDVKAGKDATTYGGWGIYPDEGSTGFKIFNNVVYECGSQGLHQHYGENNDIYNNIFVFNEDGQVRSTRLEDHKAFHLHSNILAGNNQLMYQYIEKGKFTDDKNLYFDYAAGPGVVYSGFIKKADSPSNTDVAGMFDMGYYSNGVFEDPCFIDPDNRNFGLKSTAAADKIGFTVFDYSKVGSETYGSRYLINTLAGALSVYPDALVSAYKDAKETFLSDRNNDSLAAIRDAYKALHALDASVPYLNEDVGTISSGSLYEAYTTARTALLEAANKKADISETSDVYKALKDASEAMKASGGSVTLVNEAKTETRDFTKYGETMTLPSPEKDGYVFAGWQFGSLLLSGDVRVGCGSTELTAVWAAAHKLSFEGNASLDKTVGEGLELGTLPAVEKEGYLFIGWNTAADGSGETVSEDFAMPASDLTLYPVWQEAATLVFDTDGSKRVLAVGDQAGILPVPSKKNAIFLSWNTAEDGSGTTYSSDTKVTAGTTNLYAQWKTVYTLLFDNEYSFADNKFNLKNDSGSKSCTVPYAVWEDEAIFFTKSGADCFIKPDDAKMKLIPGHIYRFTYSVTEAGEKTSNFRMTMMPYDSKNNWGSDYYVENLITGNTFTVTDPYVLMTFRPGANNNAADGAEMCYSDFYVCDVTDMDGLSDPLLGDKVEHSRFVEPGASVGELPIMKCPGYTFLGWNTEKDGSGTTFTADTAMPEATTHLWPMWEKTN